MPPKSGSSITNGSNERRRSMLKGSSSQMRVCGTNETGLPALKAGNIYVRQRSGLGTMLLDYTMRKVSAAPQCRNSVLERDAWHEAWGGDADWYTPRRPPAHASRRGFLDTPDSFSLPPSALVEAPSSANAGAAGSEESPARKAEMVGKAPQFTTSRGWKLTVKGIDCVEGEMAWNGIPLPMYSSSDVASNIEPHDRFPSGGLYGLQSERERHAARRRDVSAPSSHKKLSFASSSAISAIYSKTIQLHLNVQRSPNLSSTESSASSIVEMCFSKTAASTGAQTKTSAQRASSIPKVSAVRINPSGWSCCASLGRKQVVSVSRSTDNGPSPQRVPSKDVGEQPDAKRQRFLVEYSEALRICFNAPNPSHLSSVSSIPKIHFKGSRVRQRSISLHR
ncbi:hypothetical protein R3P38DRAFT_3453263 [Favolaschia claudopus]|uniref:Uncharacterized protein n=1 Tax=Favolaschia claudopus TaxID=2862362 RepID=A0AAW0CQ01_9AGAR